MFYNENIKKLVEDHYNNSVKLINSILDIKKFDKIFRALERNIHRLNNIIITSSNIDDIITNLNSKQFYEENYHKQKLKKKSIISNNANCEYITGLTGLNNIEKLNNDNYSELVNKNNYDNYNDYDNYNIYDNYEETNNSYIEDLENKESNFN